MYNNYIHVEWYYNNEITFNLKIRFLNIKTARYVYRD